MINSAALRLRNKRPLKPLSPHLIRILLAASAFCFFAIALNSLKKPNRHTLRQPNSVLRKIRLIKTLVFSLSIVISLSSVHHPGKPLSCPQSRLFKMPALVPFKGAFDTLPRQQIITLTDTVAHL